MKFAFMSVEKACFPIAFMARHLGVSKSGYYAWCKRPECARAREDRRLALLTREAFEIGRKNYGSPRVLRELQANGVNISRKRVIRLLRQQPGDHARQHIACAARRHACVARRVDINFAIRRSDQRAGKQWLARGGL